MLCSIRHNKIGDKGASALAAILKETMLPLSASQSLVMPSAV
jgi:hypothetical protein